LSGKTTRGTEQVSHSVAGAQLQSTDRMSDERAGWSAEETKKKTCHEAQGTKTGCQVT